MNVEHAYVRIFFSFGLGEFMYTKGRYKGLHFFVNGDEDEEVPSTHTTHFGTCCSQY